MWNPRAEECSPLKAHGGCVYSSAIGKSQVTNYSKVCLLDHASDDTNAVSIRVLNLCILLIKYSSIIYFWYTINYIQNTFYYFHIVLYIVHPDRVNVRCKIHVRGAENIKLWVSRVWARGHMWSQLEVDNSFLVVESFGATCLKLLVIGKW